MPQFLFGLLICLVAPCFAHGQLVFNLDSTGDANADAGFQTAADFWSSIVTDDITVNLDLGFQNLGGSVLGQAGSNTETVQYTAFRSAVQDDITSGTDNVYFNGLTSNSSLAVYINGVSEGSSPFLDIDGGANNISIRMTTANAKALGLRDGTNTQTDATITFNNQFAFDFDQSDGISSGQIDFVGVAIHEIGHALGFTSGVDILDANFNQGFSANQFPFITPLDLTKHSADSVAAGADLDFTADNRAKFYSIDGGVTAGGGLVGGLDHFSRGVSQGDGRQASHWRDGLGLGIMDPTAAPAGSLNVFTDLDLQAFDIIGYDLVVAIPEPGSLTFLLGLSVLGLARRRRTKC